VWNASEVSLFTSMKSAEFAQNRLALNVALAIKTPVSDSFNISQDSNSSDVHNCLECSHNIALQEIFLSSFQACLILQFCKRDRIYASVTGFMQTWQDICKRDRIYASVTGYMQIYASVPCDDLKQCLRLVGGEARSNSYTQIVCLCM